MTIKKNLIKMLLIFWFVMVIGSLFGGFSLLAQAEDQKGEMLALSCTSCHGTHGLSPGAMPTLFGKSLKSLRYSCCSITQPLDLENLRPSKFKN